VIAEQKDRKFWSLFKLLFELLNLAVGNELENPFVEFRYQLFKICFDCHKRFVGSNRDMFDLDGSFASHHVAEVYLPLIFGPILTFVSRRP
jgi:hypothetical protein